MNLQIAKSIKIISIIAITFFMGLVGWNFYLNLQGESLPSYLNSAFWLGSIILIAHGAEGMVAASKASSQGKNPLSYGIYTFFVGFVGLQELSND